MYLLPTGYLRSLPVLLLLVVKHEIIFQKIMNNHNNHLPDYREIIKYERKIVELLNHNVHQYRYVGEEGKEYEVIQSVFNEINHLPGLSNKHIRWYAIIINLRMSFQNRLMAAKSRGWVPGFPLSEFPGDFLHSLLDSTGADGDKIMTRVEKGKANDPYSMLILPPYMGLIDSYVNQIARLGMLVCTKEQINTDYLLYKLEKINSLLAELLEEMDSQKQEETREEVFILTIKNAADNAIKLGKPLLNQREKSAAPVNREVYQRLIIQRIRGIDKKRLVKYNNMEAFWNGFIP